jgi:hypothetical protein
VKDRSADSGAPDLVESWFLPDRLTLWQQLDLVPPSRV